MTQEGNIETGARPRAKRRLFPFNAEQTINLLSEFGPLVTMFVVNAIYGINIGTWALIITTGMAIVAMLYIFHRPPFFPLIASTVTIVFGALTIITGDPMWVLGCEHQYSVRRVEAGHWRVTGLHMSLSWATGNQHVTALGPLS